MGTISELEQRITAAFERMDRGLESLSRRAPMAEAPAAANAAPPALAVLIEALQQAKAANVTWAERFAALEAERSAEVLALAGEIARLSGGEGAPAPAPMGGDGPAPDRDAEIDELTARIAQQEAELETLRARTAQDAREIGELVAALAPLVAEAEVPHV
jgi:hypothetical protein